MAAQKFEAFFADPVYLFYKNHLYNYWLRRRGLGRKLRARRFAKVLEIGCGISPMLNAGSNVIYTDLSRQALSHLKSHSRKGRSAEYAVCEAGALPFRSESVEAVVCSEVIEHIPDDTAALREFSRVLARGGELFLTCPVNPKLYGFDDSFVGHHRRYVPAELIGRLESCGFKRVAQEPLMGPLEKFVMENVTRLFSKFQGERKTSGRPGIVFRSLGLIFLPFYWLGNLLLAFGVALQARLLPEEKAVTILIQCRKSI